MARNFNWTRTRMRSALQTNGVRNFRVLRDCGITQGFDSDNKKCVVRMSNLFVAFYGTYEIEIPIFEIDIMKITKDFPYLNILIFTKRNESLEFHIPVFNDNDR